MKDLKKAYSNTENLVKQIKRQILASNGNLDYHIQLEKDKAKGYKEDI